MGMCSILFSGKPLTLTLLLLLEVVTFDQLYLAHITKALTFVSLLEMMCGSHCRYDTSNEPLFY